MRAVAAAYQKDVLHRAAFDGVDHRRGAVAQHLVGKAGGQDMPAVDATHAPVGAVSAQGQRLVDEGGEILAALLVLRDVLQPGIAHHRRGIDTVGIAGTGRHDAVGGHQNGRGKAVELALLVLPGGAEVSDQLRVFSQPRIPVGGQHLAVGVHVDTGACRLLQQLVQVLQIVAGYHDERPPADIRVDLCGGRVAEGGGVGPVQQGHALVVHQAELRDERQPLLHGVLLPQGTQPFVEPTADRLILLPQAEGVMGIGRHTLHAEQQRGAQGHDVRIAAPQPARVLYRQALGRQLFGTADIALQGRIVKIYVGQRGEQAVRQQVCDLRGIVLLSGIHLRQVDEGAHQIVLQIGGFRLLAADAGADAAAVARRLLTLEAKHFRHRIQTSRQYSSDSLPCREEIYAKRETRSVSLFSEFQ